GYALTGRRGPAEAGVGQHLPHVVVARDQPYGIAVGKPDRDHGPGLLQPGQLRRGMEDRRWLREREGEGGPRPRRGSDHRKSPPNSSAPITYRSFPIKATRTLTTWSSYEMSSYRGSVDTLRRGASSTKKAPAGS